METTDPFKDLLASIRSIQESLQTQHDEHNEIKQQLVEIVSALSELVGRKDIVGSPDSSSSSLSSNGSEKLRIHEQLFQRNCMRDAILKQTVRLVESLPYTGTEIPDLIFEKGVVDESDIERLRNLQTTNDQISGLISLILMRDKACMDAFLEIIQPHCDNIIKDIRETYQCLVQDSDHIDRVSCSVCEIKSSCEIKWVYNHLFEKKLISGDLHRKIAFVSDHISSDDLWDEILRQLEHRPPMWIISVLVEAVEKHEASNGTLLLLLKRLLRKGRQLRCYCSAKKQNINLSALKEKSDMLADIYEPETSQIGDETTNEHSLPDDRSNIQQLQHLKTYNEEKVDSTNNHLHVHLSKQADTTIPKRVQSDQSSNEYETIWSVKQNSSTGSDENLTKKEPTFQGEEDQKSPELTRKGSGSKETQVKRAIGDHNDGTKFHKKHYDFNKLKVAATKYRLNKQINVNDSSGA